MTVLFMLADVFPYETFESALYDYLSSLSVVLRFLFEGCGSVSIWFETFEDALLSSIFHTVVGSS